MDIWVLSGSYEGDPFVSTHIQRKGALVAGILDIYDFMGVNDREEWKTYFEVRGGYSRATGRDMQNEGSIDCSYYYPDELKALSDDRLGSIFAALVDLDAVYDNDQGYRVTVIKTKLVA